MAAFDERLDAASAAALKRTDSPRGHLGASQVGSSCARASWYGFRWFARPEHGGRILRLFNRGHEEEPRLARWLRAAGIEVRDYAERLCINLEGHYQCVDWEQPLPPDIRDVSASRAHQELAASEGTGPRQWGFALTSEGPAARGHFSGSCDGKIRGLVNDFPVLAGLGEWGLLECKTSNHAGFQKMSAKGVKTAAPTYHIQMQIYMHFMRLDWGLFLMVNKNDDHIYSEIVIAAPEVALQNADRAMAIIGADVPPIKLSNDPSWFECRFCDFKGICHYDDQPLRNCRTCAYSLADPSGDAWRCENNGGAEIPLDFQRCGCDQWVAI